ncbi:MAG TPA: hydrogenase maturation protease [Euryarchaeota archaeon]|nr:hydrogenase maturation protease [Euryarchaeota archaeon]
MNGDGKEKGLLLVCLGNEHRGDDAVGLFIARHLKNMGLKDDDVLEAGMNLVGHISKIEEISPSSILIVDAAKMGLKPGEWKIIDVSEIQNKGLSTHENNFPVFISYMNFRHPEISIRFLGIQVASTELSDSMTLSSEVKRGALALIGIIGSRL